MMPAAEVLDHEDTAAGATLHKSLAAAPPRQCECPSSLYIRVVERVEHVDQTIGEEKEEINIKHLFNIWRV